jgi:FKBP-type peptidyl-prolyl cis-trans isomerase FkpA
MKSPLKRLMLCSALMILSVAGLTKQLPTLQAAEAGKKPEAVFKHEGQKSAYAIGLLMAQSVLADLKVQQQLGVDLQAEDVLLGVQDGLQQEGKLDQSELQQVLKDLNQQFSQRVEAKKQKEASRQTELGEPFRQSFACQKGVVKTKSGLLYQLIRPGHGAHPKESDTVKVHYQGTLVDGSTFDSSYDRNEPTTFLLNRVIPGWIEGLQQVKKGGKIKLVIPPQLAYGEQGVAGIPGNATLVFEVELLDINPEAAQQIPTESSTEGKISEPAVAELPAAAAQ